MDGCGGRDGGATEQTNRRWRARLFGVRGLGRVGVCQEKTFCLAVWSKGAIGA